MANTEEEWASLQAEYEADREWTLRLYRDLFPYVKETLLEIAGIPPDVKLGPKANHEDNLAICRAWDEYAKGVQGDDPRIRQLHTRARGDFGRLAGLPQIALSIPDEWRILAELAGIAPADVDRMTSDAMRARVRIWLLVRQASTRPATSEAATGEVKPPATGDDAYAPIGKLWKERFKTPYRTKTAHDFLKSHNIRHRSPRGNRLEVHAGDWSRYWIAANNETFEELDQPVVPSTVDTRAFIENYAKLHLKKVGK